MCQCYQCTALHQGAFVRFNSVASPLPRGENSPGRAIYCGDFLLWVVPSWG